MRYFSKIVFLFLSIFILAQTTVQASLKDIHSQAGLIDKDITITVPGTFPGGFQSDCKVGLQIGSIQRALACLNDTMISPSATVTIKVTKNNVNNGKTIYVNHPNGDRIHIIGDCGAACELDFSQGQNGIIIDNGHTLGLLSNVYLNGDHSGVGISVSNNSLLILSNPKGTTGQTVTISNFGQGMNIVENSTINVGETLDLKNNVNAGLGIGRNSYFNALAGGAINSVNNTYGAYIGNGSNALFYHANISNNKNYGVYVVFSSSLQLEKNSMVNNNGAGGILDDWNSDIYSNDSTVTATGNKGSELRCTTGSYIKGINGQGITCKSSFVSGGIGTK